MMCGIAGILTAPGAEPPSFDTLHSMVAMLRHRGPDEYGYYRDERVGLGHARLSIIDLAGGAQPLSNEDGTIWVTFNGEIFNYVELRNELERAGHRFATRTDTEVIVHAFEEYGPAAWRRFNGQFAFALWDRRERQLWLVRDPLGILPLFYATAGEAVVFASEVKALFAAAALAPRFDAAVLRHVFTRWAAVPPATVFAGVRCLPPGTALCFNDRLRATESRHWRLDLAPAAELSRLSLDEAADELDARLRAAVRFRLRADVPVGAYLSGGLDSSTIVSLLHAQDGQVFQTFAIRFADPDFDETEPQRRMARLLHTEHHEIVCAGDDIRAALPEVVWHCETPLLRTAPVPLYLLSGLVGRHGMKVVLTGEGADEFLAGYDIFKEDQLRRFWARQPESSRRPALFARLYADVGHGQQQTPFWRQFFARGLLDLDDPYYSHRVRWENTAWGLRFLSPELLADGGATTAEAEGDVAAALPAGWRAWPALARAQAIEIATFMSPYLLCSQGDRVAMAHGVEVRYPFLDPEVIAWCGHLPHRLRLRGLRDKVALRRLASRRLPPDIAERPKRPYRAPMTRALWRSEDTGYVEELLSPSQLRRFGLVDAPAAERLVAKARARRGAMTGEREEMALVGLLTLQLLAHQFLVELAGRVEKARAGLSRTPPAVRVDRLSRQWVPQAI